jgi:hypothetical protein
MVLSLSGRVCRWSLAAALFGCQGTVGEPGQDLGSPRAAADPGTVTLHRLNRAEYNNTVRDLLGTEQRPADDFPPDDRGYGFDNIASVLVLSATHVEMYQAAAETLVDEALASGASEALQQFEAETVGGSAGGANGAAWNLSSNGEVAPPVTVEAAGEYRVVVRAWAQQAGPDPARMTLTVGGTMLDTFDVTGTEGAPGMYEATTTLAAGLHVVSAAFVNDFYDEASGADRNLLVDWIRVEGPIGAMPGESSARARIMICDPADSSEAACADEIFGAFARRAWRRPVTEAELDRLRGFLDVARSQSEGFEAGIRLGLIGILTAPQFVFRVETDADPAATEPHRVSDYELATRLSYFLWSSTPDDTLLDLAAAGQLQNDEVLVAQVDRMLDDPKSEALVQNFAGQWLHARNITDHAPDYMTYPDFDEELRASYRTEIDMFFREFLTDDIPVEEMLTADWTYVDSRLARHYGLPDPGTGFQRVTLPMERSAGILSKGGLLMVTSYSRRTSPVKRGQWVLSQLLCSEPPPPPPGVEALEELEVMGTLRQRLEAHRTNPVCFACHSQMDPIGFGLENFDGVGMFRTMEGESAIDSSGELPNGETFTGAAELGNILAGDDRFTTCVAEKLSTYAIGRGFEGRADEAWVDDVAQRGRAQGSSLRAFITAIVTSDPFRMRRGQGGS